jgi:hypothetical protein
MPTDISLSSFLQAIVFSIWLGNADLEHFLHEQAALLKQFFGSPLCLYTLEKRPIVRPIQFAEQGSVTAPTQSDFQGIQRDQKQRNHHRIKIPTSSFRVQSIHAKLCTLPSEVVHIQGDRPWTLLFATSFVHISPGTNLFDCNNFQTIKP